MGAAFSQFLIQTAATIAAMGIAFCMPLVRRWLASVWNGSSKLDEVLARQRSLETEVRKLRAELGAHKAGPYAEVNRFMQERSERKE